MYDQASDPAALKNLAPTAHAVADTLDSQLSGFLQKTSSAQTQQAKLDPALQDKLHALGYMGFDAGSPDHDGKSLVNPTDKTVVVNRLEAAIFDLEEGRHQKALGELNKVVSDPDAVNAYLEFGIALARHQRYQDALPLLRTAARKLPNSAAAHYELALVLVNTRQWAAALPEMTAASKLKPDSVQLHFFIASVYGHLNQIPSAIAEYDKALTIDPDDFDTNLTYGRLLLQLGRLDAALLKLGTAVRVRPQSAEAHGFLAQAYAQAGRMEDAERERAAAANSGH